MTRNRRGSKVLNEELWFDDLKLQVTVKKKRIKNIYLRVHAPAGDVEVTAPFAVKSEDIVDFVTRNADWIIKRRKRILTAQKSRPLYLPGDMIPLWGEKYVLVWVKSALSSVRLQNGCLMLTAPADSTESERERLIKNFYRDEMFKAIIATKEERETSVGQKANEYRVREMKTRWGTCNILARRIWLNLKLAEYPPRALAYVMLHELTHLWERSHNARFWQLVERVCPDWRDIRRELRS